MPVNEEPIVPDPITPRREQIAIASRHAIGATEKMPMRVIALLLLAGGCAALAPTPANIIGVAALVILAIDITQHRR